MRFAITVILLTTSINSFSQNDTVYFNSDGLVSIKEFASIFRVCKYNTETGNPEGSFVDYQKITGQVIATGSYSEEGKNGDFRFYNDKGTLIKEIAFESNIPFNHWSYYYPNGDTAYSLKVYKSNLEILQCFDSNGNPLIMNGDGSFVKEFDNAVLEGKVKDYHMNGEWSLDSDGVKLTEKYKRGDFISGKESGRYYISRSPRLLGYIVEYEYFTILEQLQISSFYRKRDYPRLHSIFTQGWEEQFKNSGSSIIQAQGGFPGGNEFLLEYIESRFIYPGEAQKSGITGKVVIEFTVDVDGQVKDPAILQSLGHGCDEVALDIVNNMPDWIPSLQNGELVPVKYKLPIKF